MEAIQKINMAETIKILQSVNVFFIHYYLPFEL